jgi:hypothetical protein
MGLPASQSKLLLPLRAGGVVLPLVVIAVRRLFLDRARAVLVAGHAADMVEAAVRGCVRVWSSCDCPGPTTLRGASARLAFQAEVRKVLRGSHGFPCGPPTGRKAGRSAAYSTDFVPDSLAAKQGRSYPPASRPRAARGQRAWGRNHAHVASETLWCTFGDSLLSGENSTRRWPTAVTYLGETPYGACWRSGRRRRFDRARSLVDTAPPPAH